MPSFQIHAFRVFDEQNVQNLNDPKFSALQVWANFVDPDQTAPERAVGSVQELSDLGLQSLSLHLHFLEAFLYVKSHCSNLFG